jgi:hypothetical protein
VELEQFIALRWCSCKSNILRVGTKDEIQEWISFCLEEFFPKPLTFKDATVRGLLFMKWLV